MSKAIETAENRVKEIERDIEELDRKWDRLSDQGQPTSHISEQLERLQEEKERLERFIKRQKGEKVESKPMMLLIEDNIELRDLLVEFLSADFEVTVSLDRKEIETLARQVDIVVCDYHFSKDLSFEEVVIFADGSTPVILNSSDANVSYINQVDKLQAHLQITPLAKSLIGEAA